MMTPLHANPAVSMRSALLLLMLACMLAGTPASAAESAAVHIDLDSDVVNCDAQWPGDQESLAETLKSGIAVTFVWEINVDQVNRYWLNKNIASIKVTRRVKPDLLSHTLLLEDETAGISRRVISLDEAVQFLSSLQNFPVLDRSLLAPQTTYRMSVDIQKHEGEMDRGWWSRMMHSDDFSMSLEFQLP